MGRNCALLRSLLRLLQGMVAVIALVGLWENKCEYLTVATWVSNRTPAINSASTRDSHPIMSN